MAKLLPSVTLTVRAVHTPESTSYVIYTADENRAWGVLTGDALFYGTTGRTDLTDADKVEENAALLYDAVHSKLAVLLDTVLILPAHGPGSRFGGGMAERPFSTLGEERQYNEVFTKSRQDFASKKGGEQLQRPGCRYSVAGLATNTLLLSDHQSNLRCENCSCSFSLNWCR